MSDDMERMCDYCEGHVSDLRPVCVKGREQIPNLCSLCYSRLTDAGRIDRDRDAEVFGYA